MSISIQGVQISSVECIGTTSSANPYYRVLAEKDGEPRVYLTKKDASVNYGIGNKENLWPNKVTLIMENQRIVYLVKE